MDIRTSLRLIQGDAQVAAPWMDIRSAVIARSVESRDNVATYRLAKEDWVKAAKAGRRQPLLDAWALVLGEPPPVPNIRKYELELKENPLIGLRDAVACFRGIKRPVGEDDNGWNMVAYVSMPQWYFRYDPDMVCPIRRASVPDDTVFVTYVRLDHSASTKERREARPLVTSGVVTHFEFVERDPDGSGLPLDYRERYRKRVW